MTCSNTINDICKAEVVCDDWYECADALLSDNYSGNVEKSLSTIPYHDDEYSTRGQKGLKGPVFRPTTAAMTKRKYLSAAVQHDSESVGQAKSKTKSINKKRSDAQIAKEGTTQSDSGCDAINDKDEERVVVGTLNKLVFRRHHRATAIRSENRARNKAKRNDREKNA